MNFSKKLSKSKIYTGYLLKDCFYLYLIIFLLSGMSSCKKNLDMKPSKQQAEPSTMQDLMALLNNDPTMNQTNAAASTAELLSDNYYVLSTDWQSNLASGTPSNSKYYIWSEDGLETNTWSSAYQGIVYQSNFVLDLIDKVDRGSSETIYNQVKASALFYRSFAFLALAQLYCKPYSTTATTDPGIVMRLTSNILTPSYRPTVEQTYNQIISDLKMASELLPEKTAYPTQPNKAAAFGTLARTYLNMRDYLNAGKYSDSVLARFSGLLDYNGVTPGNLPMFTANPEIIYFDQTGSSGFQVAPTGIIDTLLFASYQLNDLRKTIFFTSNPGSNPISYSFTGSYGRSNYYFFDGLTTAEMYLIRAECAARAGNVSTSMAALNTLMQNRWKASAWVPFTASNAADALSIVLNERRKELVFRGQRWPDLRRLNLEAANITLKRIIDNTVYTLPPNDLKWVLLIPKDVIEKSGVAQNPR